MKVASHAPPPGSHSGVADYAEALIPALGKFGQIERDAEEADVHLYHLGNNALHADIYARSLRKPGVIVLHDAVLHHYLLGTLSHEEYMAEWTYNYGEWRREAGEELWRERKRSGTDPRYFRFPMIRRVIDASRSVIVHNPGAAALANAHGASTLSVIPHFFEPAAENFGAAEVDGFRRSLGASRATTLFGIFGYLRETKRVSSSMASFRRIHAAGRDVALLLAGEAVSPDLERLLRAQASHPAIHRRGHLTERELRLAMASIDCCLNLRYPAAGETSGIAIRAMGIGKPVIGSDIAENADFPETAMLRVSPGVSETDELLAQMTLTATFPDLRAEIGRQAACHIRKYHALEIVAQQYWQVLEKAAKLT